MKTAGGREDLISLAGPGPSSLAGCRHGRVRGGPPGRSLKDLQPLFETMGHELAGSSNRGGRGWWGNLIDGTAVARVLGGRGSRWQIAKPVLSSGRKEPKLGQCS